MRFTKITALAAVGTLVAAVSVASSAQAATQHNGVVEVEEFGLYYSQGSNGSWVFDTSAGEADFRKFVFPGTNVHLDNNTASYRNRRTGYFYVCTGYSWTGAKGQIPPGYVGNASATYRNTISSSFYTCGC
jgi:hypothetical protein